MLYNLQLSRSLESLWLSLYKRIFDISRLFPPRPKKKTMGPVNSEPSPRVLQKGVVWFRVQVADFCAVLNTRYTSPMETKSALRDYKYHLLAGAYVLVTGGAMLRVYRQPYNRNMKIDQIETIFKATTLGAVIVGIGLSGKINKPRSTQD